MSSRTRHRTPAERLPSPPPTPPLPSVDSPTTPYTSFEDMPTSADYHRQSQFVIGKDLCRAINELRAVPSLRWPTKSVEFSEYNADIDDDDDSVFGEGDVRRRRLDKEWRPRRDNNNASVEGEIRYRRVVFGGSESSSNVASASSIRTFSGGANGGGISDRDRTSASRYSDNYVAVTSGEHISSDTVKFQRNSDDAERIVCVDQKTLYSDHQQAPSQPLNSRQDWTSVVEKRRQESTQLTKRSGFVQSDVIWNDERSGLNGGTIIFEAQKTAWQDSISKIVSGVVDEASAKLRFDEDDIYEMQMEELERATVTECVDDAATDFMFDSSVGGDVGFSTERLLAASFSVDEKRTISGSSCSNLSSSGVDVVNHDVDWTMHSDEVCSNECWEDSVSEKERFVRSVLIRRETSQAKEEINKVDTLEQLGSEGQCSNGFQTVFERRSRCFNSADVGNMTTFVNEAKQNELNKDGVVSASVEQTSMKRDASCPSNAFSDPTIGSTSFQINGPASSNVGLPRPNQLSYKPGLIKTITLSSFVTTSSGHVDDTGHVMSSANNGNVDANAPPKTSLNSAHSLDFTAEELFEEILESLSDVADENDEDLFEQFSSSDCSFQFTASPEVVRTSSVGGIVSPSKKNAVRGEVEQRRSELIVSTKLVSEERRWLSRIQEHVVKASDDDVVKLSHPTIESSCWTELQQSHVEIGEHRQPDNVESHDDEVRSDVPIFFEEDVNTVQPHSAVTDGCLVLDLLPVATEVKDAEPVVADDNNVDEVVSPSVKSLTTFFERMPLVVATSPKSPPNIDVVGETVGETDLDFESVVRANVDDDEDLSLDNMVDVNLREIVEDASPPMKRATVKPQSPQHLDHQSLRDGSRLMVASGSEHLLSSCEQPELQVIPEDLVAGEVIAGIKMKSSGEFSSDVMESCLVFDHTSEQPELQVIPEDLVAGEVIAGMKMKSSGEISSDVMESCLVFDHTSEQRELQVIPEDLVAGEVVVDDNNRYVVEMKSNDVIPGEIKHFEEDSFVNDVCSVQQSNFDSVSKAGDETHFEVQSLSSKDTHDVSSNESGEVSVRQDTLATANVLRQSADGSVEIVSDQLTTQEIVLTIKLPHFGRKAKSGKSLLHRRGTDVQSDESRAMMAHKSEEFHHSALPFRHLHVRRVVRVIGADSYPSAGDGEKSLTAGRVDSLLLGPTTAASVSTTTSCGLSKIPISDAALNNNVDDVISGERPAISVEFDRKSRSSAVEYVTTPGDVNEVSVIREDAVRVVRLPGCGADSVRLPVLLSVGEAIDGVAHALQRSLSITTNGGPPLLLPGDVRVTCEAFERSESLMTSPGSKDAMQLMTSELGQSSVTVVSRTLWPSDADADGGLYDVIVQPDHVTSGCQPTVTSFV